ncbi:hypothetical protein [Actinoplanes auranticolor]|uniref:Uncharacterized protein n=1 Tax=Actinoplanes auranticolor TaxID=47988 RepID=A0A919SCM5_9ACTN|nr:hypothetical protein [Actinoplanes auranticolor]GIM68563.1 hypothetical protein Aau02nite_32200 [Actinoplanes auranticolor]
MTTPAREPDQHPSGRRLPGQPPGVQHPTGQKPAEPVEDRKPSLVERRRERIRAEVQQARNGDHRVPTWVLTTILIVIVVAWLALIITA